MRLITIGINLILILIIIIPTFIVNSTSQIVTEKQKIIKTQRIMTPVLASTTISLHDEQIIVSQSKAKVWIGGFMGGDYQANLYVQFWNPNPYKIKGTWSAQTVCSSYLSSPGESYEFINESGSFEYGEGIASPENIKIEKIHFVSKGGYEIMARLHIEIWVYLNGEEYDHFTWDDENIKKDYIDEDGPKLYQSSNHILQNFLLFHHRMIFLEKIRKYSRWNEFLSFPNI